ncbi:hypothetical protein PHMEG_00041918 [Phytophthora megakarya]|uniref:Uncharacterized protein n=1 Tax=Phytophthora megakarya TaxID=4795 RepID=A0A225UAM5_9STRA|nr:hypothetical protein PHMEG_00041918 [Phytophthora megakarya]
MSDSPVLDLDDAPAFHPSDASQSSSSSTTTILQPEDFVPHACWVCASGTKRPSMPPHSAVDIPAVGDYVPSITVDGLVQDATALEHETHVLRRRLELSTALTTGLAAHASDLHDRIDAQHDRTREGYDLGVALVARVMSGFDFSRCDLEKTWLLPLSPRRLCVCYINRTLLDIK